MSLAVPSGHVDRKQGTLNIFPHIFYYKHGFRETNIHKFTLFIYCLLQAEEHHILDVYNQTQNSMNTKSLLLNFFHVKSEMFLLK
jgi:hypothetical protein